MLVAAGFQFALQAEPAVVGFNADNDGGVRPSQYLSQKHTRLGIAEIVRLQTGHNEIELLPGHSRGQGACDIVCVQGGKAVIFKVNSAVGAFGQSLAQHLLRSCGAGGDHYYLAAMLFFLPQRFFQSVRVGLVHFVGHVFTYPCTGVIQLEGRIFLRHLLDANKYFHWVDDCVLVVDLPKSKQLYPLSSRPKRTRISYFAPPETYACAALLKESRMHSINAMNLNRKFGVAKWRDLRCALRPHPLYPHPTDDLPKVKY